MFVSGALCCWREQTLHAPAPDFRMLCLVHVRECTLKQGPPDLESRGPGTNPLWGRKWLKNGFWPHLGNGRKMARNMRKMARHSIFEPFSAHFCHFPGHIFPHFPGEAKIHFSAIFVPISGVWREN